MKTVVDWSKNKRFMQPPEDWWLVEIGKRLIKGSVLDIGCGQGRFAEFLGQEHDYLGIDINPSEIKIAQKLHPNQQFICADILNWQWKKFDNIFSWVTLQHIPPPVIYNLFKTINKYGKNILICEVTTPIESDYQWTHPYKKYFKLIDEFPVMSGISYVMQFRGGK